MDKEIYQQKMINLPRLTAEAIADEGWKVRGNKIFIDENRNFPVCHPFSIHCKLYREESSAELKFQHLRAMHDYLWPYKKETWNYWEEERLRTHCEGWKYISYAGGSGIGKSADAAIIALLFWLSDPFNHSVIVASTTLASLESRIYGYIKKYLLDAVLPVEGIIRRGGSPKILSSNLDDSIHAIVGVAATPSGSGVDSQKTQDSIKNWIGRHPNKGLLLVLDEGTDIPISILEALPNLEAQIPWFQCMIIGNSKRRNDLHGLMSTPKQGWNSISPNTHTRWETVMEKGICLYFSPFNSPAIHEKDVVRRAALERFLISQKQLDEKKKKYARNSEAWWRFVLGFWKSENSADTAYTEKTFTEFQVNRHPEWSGVYPIKLLAALDPAFSNDGNTCFLRFARMGHTTDTKIVIDFNIPEAVVRIDLDLRSNETAETQISKRVISELAKRHLTLHDLIIDGSGCGRALPDLMKITSKRDLAPLRLISIYGSASVAGSPSYKQNMENIDSEKMSAYELWMIGIPYMQSYQIVGIDDVAKNQFIERRCAITDKGKIELETKTKFSSNMNSSGKGYVVPSGSPDEADTVNLIIKLAEKRFGFRVGQTLAMPSDINGLELQKLQTFYAMKKIASDRQGNAYGEISYSGDIDGPPSASFASPLEDLIWAEES